MLSKQHYLVDQTNFLVRFLNYVVRKANDVVFLLIQLKSKLNYVVCSKIKVLREGNEVVGSVHQVWLQWHYLLQYEQEVVPLKYDVVRHPNEGVHNAKYMVCGLTEVSK